MMARIIVALLLLQLVLTKPSNCQKACSHTVLTFLKTDTELPGPSMNFDISLASGVFEFEFKTWVDRALVLYQDDGGISDHIQLSIQEGRLWFLFFGSKNNEPGSRIHGKFTSEKKYNNFKWHRVRIERNASVTSIFINHGRPGEEKKRFQTNGLSSFTSKLLIGGFARDIQLNDLSSQGAFRIYAIPLDKKGFFNACVRNIKYGETLEDMKGISKRCTSTFKVEGGCNLNHCHKPEPICKNNGKCSPLEKKDAVTCDCRWTGFVEPYCQGRALELKLDGTYKVVYTTQNHEDQDRFKFRLKTFQKNALLFYAEGATNTEDFLIIEIESSKLKLVINFGEQGVNYTAVSRDIISDGEWHIVEYTKQVYDFTLKVDKTSKTFEIKSQSYKRVDYGKRFSLGEILKEPYTNDVIIQDFIWKLGHGNNKKEVNFVTGLYKSYYDHNEGFEVLPESVRPKFDQELPSFTPKPMPITLPTAKPGCKEGQCGVKNSIPTPQTTGKLSEPKNVARSEEDDDDSSVTWIVVVTVILSVLLFAAIAFFVHKWNRRYSGDFQVNRKPVGPADTVVHYNSKEAHKEKQRQMRL